LALTGTLREFGLVDLLSLVRVTRKSGILAIHSQAEALDLYFRDGRLIRFTTSANRLDLGDLLVRAGKATREQVAATPEAGLSSERAASTAVMEATGLSRAELLALCTAEAGKLIGQALMWHDGDFAFRDRVEVPDDAITFDLDVGGLIEGLRSRQDQWRVLRSVLPHLHYRLRFPAARRPRLEPLMLSPVEWSVVTQIGSASTLDEIRERLNLDEFQIRQSVQRLVSEGLLEIEEAPAEPIKETDSGSAEADDDRGQSVAIGASAAPRAPRAGFIPRLLGRKRP